MRTTAVLNHAHRLAVDLAQHAGDTALAALGGAHHVSAKGSASDLVTAVDVACEDRMIERLRQVFPGHRITGEEHGSVGASDSPWEWHLDPLDGTHNFVMGMTMFGVCITLCHKGEPVVAVMHDSVRRLTTSAVCGQGAWVEQDGRRTRLQLPTSEPVLSQVTLSWVQGYAIANDDPYRLFCLERLRLPVKRVLHTWAPSIDWSLAAAGHVGAVILYANQIHDMIGGRLLLPEAGGVVRHDAARDVLVAGRASVVEWVVERLQLTVETPTVAGPHAAKSHS